LERDLEGQMQVLRVSAWSSVGRQLAARYGVRGVPTFLLFDGSGQIMCVRIAANSLRNSSVR
jgi:thioredoxin-related protein